MIETYVIHTTKKCNLGCIYCYEEDKESEYTLKEVVENIDNIFKDIKDNIVHIEFLGGEPLLEFEILRDSFFYMEKNYAENISSYTITTNGTILKEEILSFLKENSKISIAISMDGTQFANQLRFFKKDWKNSYFTVAENIKKIHDNGLEASVHIVTHPYNISYMFESIRHLHEELLINNIGIGTVESTIKINEEYCNEFKKQIMLVADYVINNPNLKIDLFCSLKPREDVRTYVRDIQTNKLVFESYGRIKNDIFLNSSKYHITKCSEKNDVAEKIYELRKFAFDYYGQKETENMSLLDEDQKKFIETSIRDCVGKVGFCEYVTNPLNNSLYKNLNIKSTQDFKSMLDKDGGVNAPSKNKIDFTSQLSSPTKNECEEQPQQSLSADDEFKEVIARALKEIILQLIEIKSKL
jgi:sulfatase maturation enzyme AslB (radical SAM superfamily)